jgi:hypothetical protein
LIKSTIKLHYFFLLFNKVYPRILGDSCGSRDFIYNKKVKGDFNVVAVSLEGSSGLLKTENSLVGTKLLRVFNEDIE